MHAAAANRLTLAPELTASALEVGSTPWPSAIAAGEMHAATEAASGVLMAHLTWRAGSLSESATRYTVEDLRDADPFKALGELL